MSSFTYHCCKSEQNLVSQYLVEKFAIPTQTLQYHLTMAGLMGQSLAKLHLQTQSSSHLQ